MTSSVIVYFVKVSGSPRNGHHFVSIDVIVFSPRFLGADRFLSFGQSTAFLYRSG